MISKINELWENNNITAEGVYDFFEIGNFDLRCDQEAFVNHAGFYESLRQRLLELIDLWSDPEDSDF